MTASDDDLYRTVILDHSRNPRGASLPAGATCRGAADNPFCGDRFTVGVAIDAGDGARIAGVGFEGAGCAISTASASMMTAAVHGRTRAEVEALYRSFDHLVAGAEGAASEAASEGGEAPPSLGELAAFAGVARFPVRAKCARLPWQALLAALAAPR